MAVMNAAPLHDNAVSHKALSCVHMAMNMSAKLQLLFSGAFSQNLKPLTSQITNGKDDTEIKNIRSVKAFLRKKETVYGFEKIQLGETTQGVGSGLGVHI